MRRIASYRYCDQRTTPTRHELMHFSCSVLRHENIVHCMGCCSQPGNLFIVSELFSRGSLQQIVSDKSIPLPIELGTKLALDAANGYVVVVLLEPPGVRGVDHE